MSDEPNDVSIAVLNQNILTIKADIADIKAHLARQNGRVFDNTKDVLLIKTRLENLIDDHKETRKDSKDASHRFYEYAKGNALQIITIVVLILEIAGIL
jgi:vacuolar-type H+-ATPase subunit B/Vma2